MKRSWSAMVFFFFLMAHGWAVDFRTVASAGHRYTICTVNLKEESLDLFLQNRHGNAFTSFSNLERELLETQRDLAFGMNAGMYEPDFLPVGLFVAKGLTLSPLNLRDGPGNFYWKPNGVFYVDRGGAHILESSRFASAQPHALLATQSGPLLVAHQRVNSQFLSTSTSRLRRNGVGIVTSRKVVFVISEDAINFYEMAHLFRDDLGCSEALYFDGNISSLYAPKLVRKDSHSALGPIIGVVNRSQPN